MATIQLEPGSKTITARLVDGTVMTSSAATRRINGATQIVHKPYQTIRCQFPGESGFATFVGNASTRYINLPSGTTLVFRSV